MARVEVEYFACGVVVVAEDEPPLSHLWVFRTGALEAAACSWQADPTQDRALRLSAMAPTAAL